MSLSDADAYDRFMGRYSRPLAVPFADFAGLPLDGRVLDVGCGPGARFRSRRRRGFRRNGAGRDRGRSVGRGSSGRGCRRSSGLAVAAGCRRWGRRRRIARRIAAVGAAARYLPQAGVGKDRVEFDRVRRFETCPAHPESILAAWSFRSARSQCP